MHLHPRVPLYRDMINQLARLLTKVQGAGYIDFPAVVNLLEAAGIIIITVTEIIIDPITKGADLSMIAITDSFIIINRVG